MGQAKLKVTRRELRKALGPEAFDILQTHDIRIRAHAALLHRGFWGRLKWLLRGK